MNLIGAQPGLLSLPPAVIDKVVFQYLTDAELQKSRLVCKRLNGIALQNLIQRFSSRSESEPNPIKKFIKLEIWMKLSKVKMQQAISTPLDIDDFKRMQKMMNTYETKSQEIARQIEEVNVKIRHMMNNIQA